MPWVIMRKSVKYTNGQESGILYYKRGPLGFAELTKKINEAARYRYKYEAQSVIGEHLGKGYSAVRM